MKWWQVVIAVVLLFVLFRTTSASSSEMMYANPDLNQINQASIDYLYVEPNIRNAEIFMYQSPSEWAAKKMTYSYLGPPNPDYYPDRVPDYSQPIYQGQR